MNNLPPTVNLTAAKTLLDEAKIIAKKYKHLTGRPLGITGEVGEVEAAILLDLLMPMWQMILIRRQTRLFQPSLPGMLAVRGFNGNLGLNRTSSSTPVWLRRIP
jgi:hypothetical protein